MTGKYISLFPIQKKSLIEQVLHLRQDERMIDIDHLTPYDLRKIVITGFFRLGCLSEVLEAALENAITAIKGTWTSPSLLDTK